MKLCGVCLSVVTLVCQQNNTSGYIWTYKILMPRPLTVSCFSKIQTGSTFLVPAYPDSPGQRAVKWVCVCVCYIRSLQFMFTASLGS